MNLKRLLLISNSTNFGGGYLDHCAGKILELVADSSGWIAFVPFASGDCDAAASRARGRFASLGLTVRSVHEAGDEIERARIIHDSRGVFVGGGNTFRLLTALYRLNLVDDIRTAVSNGLPYIGASAGANIACPTIKSTNDMPIIYPPTFDALGLIPFNINPHFIDADPTSTHMGETREKRIAEFHELNDVPVLGLREGAMLQVLDAQATLAGESGARLFRKQSSSEELAPGARLDFLLDAK